MASMSKSDVAWFICDLVVVVVFVVIGRHTHHHGETLTGVISTTWPFAVGLVVGWAGVISTHTRPSSLLGGVAIWLSTVGIGMVLRVISGQGTDVAFIVVALGFLGLFLLGTRAIATRSRWKFQAP
jgi:hypothetical protein